MDIEELKHLINNSKNDPAGGFKLKIKVSANSKKDSFEFLDDDPSGNILNLPKSNITILNGEKSSQKCLLIRPKANIIKNI